MVFKDQLVTCKEFSTVVDTLRTLIKGEPDLTCSLSDEFLHRFIRASQYDAKVAFKMLKEYFMAKRDMPNTFIPKTLSKTLSTVSRIDIGYVLPHPDQCGRRVIYFRLGNVNPDKESFETIADACVIVFEVLTHQEDVQDNGLAVILDCTNFSFKIMKWITPYNLKMVLRAILVAFPAKFEVFHIVNAPTAFNIFYTSIKMFVPKEVQKKIKWHSRQVMKDLSKDIGFKNVPFSLGGELKEEMIIDWYKIVLPYEPLFDEIRSMGYIDKISKR